MKTYAGLSLAERLAVTGAISRHAPEPYHATRINWPLLLGFIAYCGFFGWLAYQLGGWVRGLV